MNFFCDSRGTIFHVDPEPIYQNSAGANELYFIGAFPSSAQVTVSYKLPNGLYTEPKLMTSVTDSTLDITDQYGKGFSVWKEMLGQSVMTDGAGNIVYGQDYTVTENYGKVDVQFVVYVNGQGASRLGTASGSFEVVKGVPIILPDGIENDILTQILASLQTVIQDITKNTDDITALQDQVENNAIDISKNTQNIEKNTSNIEKNSNNISLLAEVQYQSGLQYIQPIEEEYGERVTANGEKILDWQGNGSTARLLKVEGNTQPTRNLINPALTTGIVTYAVDGNSIVITNSKGAPSSFYLYSVKRAKGTYTLSVKDIVGESSRRFLTIYKDGVVQQTITTFPAVVTITLDEDAEISLRGEVGIGEYNTTTISELQLVEGVYTEDTMPKYTLYFDGLKSASFQGIISRQSQGTQRSWFDFPAPIECGLGVTIDFKKQVIINKYSEVTLAGEDSEGWKVSFGWNGMDDDGNVAKGYAYAPITAIRDFIKGSELFSGQWKLASISSMYEDDPELVDTMPPDKGEYYIACDENGTHQTLYLGTGDMLSNWSTMLADWKEYLKKNPITLRCFTTTETVIPFTDEQKAVGNEYTAWKGGEERVQGNDNATYDINPTLTQEYVVITSVKEDTV